MKVDDKKILIATQLSKCQHNQVVVVGKRRDDIREVSTLTSEPVSAKSSKRSLEFSIAGGARNSLPHIPQLREPIGQVVASVISMGMSAPGRRLISSDVDGGR